MYCKKCGKELEDTAKFCDGCGDKQQSASIPFDTAAANAVLGDGKRIIKSFFSKNPGSALVEAGSSSSKMGVVLVAINVFLFGLVPCFNITQVINHMIKATTDAITSTTNSMLGSVLGGAMTKQAIPTVEVPVAFDFFPALVVFALAVTAIVFASIYITFKLSKRPSKGFFTVANVVGVSGLPIATALLVNFILGFVLPQFTPFVFLAAMLVSLVALYEGFKTLLERDTPLIAEFAILVLLVSIVFAIGLQFALAQAGNAVQDTIIQAAGKGLEGLGGVFGSFLG